MTELTLAAVGATAITEGIKFFYGQAKDLLKRRRDRAERRTLGASAEPSEGITLALPNALGGGRDIQASINFGRLERVAEQIGLLRKDLSDYAEGLLPVDQTDLATLRRVDALRSLLEAVLGETLTFEGERRLPTGTRIAAELDVDQLLGYAAAVRAQEIGSGNIRASARVGTVGPGGVLVGVEVGKIGK